MGPGPLPSPPADLRERRLSLLNFSGSLFRSHGIEHHPVFYGTTGRFRFDAPDGSYGVLYAATDAYAAFAESLVSNPENRVLTTSFLKRKSLAELRPQRALRLADLVTPGALVRIGADSRLFSGERSIAQLWSKAFHDHPEHADGILYPSRLDPNRRCLAIFGDRDLNFVELAREAWYAAGRRRELLAEIAEHYEIELIEDHLIPPRKPIEEGET